MSTLQEIIDAAPDGTQGAPTVIDLTGQTFTEEQMVSIDGRSWLTIQGGTFLSDTDGSGVGPPVGQPPSITANWPRARSMFRVQGPSKGISFVGCSLRGPHPNGGENGAYVESLEGQHGIAVFGGSAEDILIDDCTISDFYGDLVYLNLAQRATVRSCELTRNGRQGLAITKGFDITVEDCHIHDIRRSGFDFEPNLTSDDIVGVVIRRCNLHQVKNNYVAGRGSSARVDDVWIIDNDFTGSLGFDIGTGAPRSGLHIIGNRIDSRGANDPAARIQNYDGVTVSHNYWTFVQNRYMAAVGLYGECTNVLVGENTLLGAASEVAVLDERSSWEPLSMAADPIEYTTSPDGLYGTWRVAVQEPEPVPTGHAADLSFDDATGALAGWVTHPDGSVWDVTGTAVLRP